MHLLVILGRYSTSQGMTLLQWCLYWTESEL